MSKLQFGLKCLIICAIHFKPIRLLSAHQNKSSLQNERGRQSLSSSGCSSFQNIRHDPSFVDKTGFVKVFLEQSDEHVYTMAPAGFGKSHLIDMLDLFLDSATVPIASTHASSTQDHNLFTGTVIHQNTAFFNRHVQQYQVIRMDCHPYRQVKDFESFRRIHCHAICRMMSRHTYLRDTKSNFSWLQYMDNDERCSTYCTFNFDQIDYAGRDLSRQLAEASPKPVVLLVDAYDSVFRAMVDRDVDVAKEVLNKYVNFVSRIVKWSNCTRSLLLGTLNFGGVHPHLVNNVKFVNFNFQSTFAPYFGFTKSEVERLLSKFKHTAALERVTGCYNGYSSRDAPKLALYNPFSVLAFLKNGKFKNYWLKEAPSLEPLKQLFYYPLIGNVIQDILLGDSGLHSFLDEKLTLKQIERLKRYARKVQSRLPSRDEVINPFIRYLTQVGYLALKPSGPFEGDYLKVPNLETEQYLEKFLYTSDYILNAIGITHAATERLADAFIGLSKNDSYFQELSDLIYDATRKNPPSHYTKPSVLGYLHAALKRPVNRKKFKVVRARVKVACNTSNEKRLKENRADLVIITPDNTGIILKYELEDSPYVNLRKIIQGRQHFVFEQKFDAYKLSQRIFIGLSFNGGKCGIRYIRNTTDFYENQFVSSPYFQKNETR
nr:PREDICTED: uncharacterized protein LOC109041746 [Bemisia tabaci]